jgi:hypothetical protein
MDTLLKMQARYDTWQISAFTGARGRKTDGVAKIGDRQGVAS